MGLEECVKLSGLDVRVMSGAKVEAKKAWIAEKLRAMRWALCYVGPCRGAVAFLSALLVISGLLSLAPPYLVKRLVDAILAPGADRAHALASLVLALGGVYAAATLVSMVVGRLATPIGARLAHAMRLDFYGAIQRMEMWALQQTQAGDLVARMIYDVQTVHVFLMDLAVAFIPQLLILGGVFIALVMLHWGLALLILLPAPLVLLLAWLHHTRIKGRFALASRLMGDLFAKANDRILGVRDIKLMGREAAELEAIGAASGVFRDALTDAVQSSVLFSPLMRLAYCLGVLPALYLGGLGVAGRAGWPWNNLTLGALAAFMTYLGLTYGPLQNLGRMYGAFTQACVSAGRLREILDSPQEPYDAPGAQALMSVAGEVRFEDVHFAYHPDKPVLQGLSFHIRPGEIIGVIGRSGAGKTTTVNLLCRFHEPRRGGIRLDGADLRQIRLECLREAIGVIPQNPWLLDATVAENIAFGKAGSTIHEIRQAARRANIDDLIMRWPQGYETRVGQGGMMLSGGERHLIAIARAFLRDPRLLILDEATAAMDHFTEEMVQARLFDLMRGRTCFVIAHRLSTLRHADRIMALEGGRMVELGTPAELLESRGMYYQMMLRHSETAGCGAQGHTL